ncbi:MAG: hypothetical protein M3347_12440 [Armatimonadota bacterium]|nr:hypothetical protein [Armatimonadota bacterium]
MAIATFEEVAEAVKALTPDEQRQLYELLNTLLTNGQVQSKEDELDQRLLAAGLLTRIPPPITDFSPYQNRKLVEIKGKPLSETIIEERR